MGVFGQGDPVHVDDRAFALFDARVPVIVHVLDKRMMITGFAQTGRDLIISRAADAQNRERVRAAHL